MQQLCPVQVDYIIVGQGLCGSWLAYYLLKEGASVLVMDAGRAQSASAAASGIINPITGKRLARQWMADSIHPFATSAYAEFGAALSRPLITELPIHTFFNDAAEAAFFAQKAETTHEDLLSTSSRVKGEEYFNEHYGIGTIYPAMLVDVAALLDGGCDWLIRQNAFRKEAFDWNACVPESAGIQYKEFSAKAVIDCSGAASGTNTFWKALPFALNKGEAIIASIPGLPGGAIYKYAQLSIVPWRDDRFWIGSTFDWDFKDKAITAAFREKAESILRQWLRLPFILEAQFAAIRPATVTRDAFAGMHPLYPQIGILNGMGSKGCSLAPFLAHNLAGHLTRGTPLIPQVDVGRYAGVLRR